MDFQPPRETRPLDVGSETGNNSGSVQVVQLPDTQIQGIGKVIGQAVGRPGENRGLTNWRVTELTQTILGWKILCPPDARRRLLTVMTLGGAFVYLSPTPLPGLGGGIVMRADLGMQLIEDTRWGNLPQIQWYVEDQGAAIYWLLEEYYL